MRLGYILTSNKYISIDLFCNPIRQLCIIIFIQENIVGTYQNDLNTQNSHMKRF